jgi:hypothetical protein
VPLSVRRPRSALHISGVDVETRDDVLVGLSKA